MKNKYLLILLISIANYFLIEPKGILILIVTSLLSFLIFKDFFKKSGVSRFFTSLLLLILIILSIKADFDKNVFTFTHLEAHKAVARHGFYSAEFGKLYSNRFGLFYSDKFRPITSKLVRNSFSQLELNQYFVAGKILSIAFLGLFFGGIIIFFRKVNTLAVIYFILSFFAGGLLRDTSKFGVVLFAPLVNVLIALGFLAMLHFFKTGKYEIK